MVGADKSVIAVGWRGRWLFCVCGPKGLPPGGALGRRKSQIQKNRGLRLVYFRPGKAADLHERSECTSALQQPRRAGEGPPTRKQKMLKMNERTH
jgi:hypothetical protein